MIVMEILIRVLDAGGEKKITPVDELCIDGRGDNCRFCMPTYCFKKQISKSQIFLHNVRYSGMSISSYLCDMHDVKP